MKIKDLIKYLETCNPEMECASITWSEEDLKEYADSDLSIKLTDAQAIEVAQRLENSIDGEGISYGQIEFFIDEVTRG